LRILLHFVIEPTRACSTVSAVAFLLNNYRNVLYGTNILTYIIGKYCPRGSFSDR